MSKMEWMSGVRNAPWIEGQLSTSEQVKKIQAEIDRLQPAYDSAQSIFAGMNEGAGSDLAASKKIEYEEAVEVYKLLKVHLSIYQKKLQAEDREKLTSDEEASESDH